MASWQRRVTPQPPSSSSPALRSDSGRPRRLWGWRRRPGPAAERPSPSRPLLIVPTAACAPGGHGGVPRSPGWRHGHRSARSSSWMTSFAHALDGYGSMHGEGGGRGNSAKGAVRLSQARHGAYSRGLEGARVRPGRRCSRRIALSVAGRAVLGRFRYGMRVPLGGARFDTRLARPVRTRSH